MIAADEKRVLRKLYSALSDEQFEAACARPDPYLAGMCAALGLEDDDALNVPAPDASGAVEIRVRWHIGRAVKTLVDKGIGVQKIRAALNWKSRGTIYAAMAIYRRHPDGRIPESSLEKAAGYCRKQKAAAAKAQPAGPSSAVQTGLDAALIDLRALARKSGLPLKAEQIAEVAARRNVNPLVLMGAWGNAVLQQGAPTSQQIIEALQKELAARNEQFQAVMKELASKDERLAAQQQVITELSGRVDDLEKTVSNLGSALGVIQEIGMKLANFFQAAGAPSSRAERAA
jgi:polyhydroxyalkanoate synthesis regulator phasin